MTNGAEKPMAAPKLTIRRYEIEEVAVREINGYDENHDANGTVEYALGTSRAKDDRQAFRVILALSFVAEKGRNVPYEVTLRLTGYFTSNVWLPERHLPASIATNAATILYGIARGLIGQITSSGVHGLFVLPTLLFSNFLAESAQNEKSGIISDEEYRKLWQRETKFLEAPKASPVRRKRAAAKRTTKKGSK
jgi:preprotein translocase subunit SecB